MLIEYDFRLLWIPALVAALKYLNYCWDGARTSAENKTLKLRTGTIYTIFIIAASALAIKYG